MDEKYKYLAIMGICIVLLGIYIGVQIDWEDVLTPRATQPVHMSGKINETKKLKNVHLENIPQSVYDSIQWGDTKYTRYLTGNQKYILITSFGNKPPLSTFKPELTRLLADKGYNQYYRRHIIDFGNKYRYSCDRMECAAKWLVKHCLQAVCITHPLKKQVIIDTSGDVNQLEELVEKYKEW